MPTFLFALLGALWAGCGRPGRPPVLLPSEAIAAAEAVAGTGEAAHGLVQLTEAICARTSAAQGRPPGLGEAAAVAADVALIDAWVGLWDVAGRPLGAERALSACYGSAPTARLLAVALADATGDWPAAARQAAAPAAGWPAALRAELALRHGIALLHLGQLRAAEQELTRSSAELSWHAGLHVALAQARLANADYPGVGRALWPLLEAPSAVPAAMLARARALMQAAREAAAPPMTPADAASHADLLRLAHGEGPSPDDVAHVEHLLQVSLQPQLWVWCALVLLKQGQVAEGRAWLQRAERALPLDPLPARLLAAHQWTADDADGALVSLLEAARRDPFDVETQQLLAAAAGRVGAWPQAHAAFAALSRLVPGEPSVHAGLQAAEGELSSAYEAASESAARRVTPPK